jgi:hypothetical protein
MRIKQWLRPTLFSILGITLIVFTSLLVQVRHLRDALQKQQTEAIYPGVDKTLPIAAPIGFSASGVVVDGSSNRSNGWIVRYAANYCKFCKQDTLWEQLASDARARNYDVVVLNPNASSAYKKSDLIPSWAPQEQYVSVEWSKHFVLVGTPTVLIFDPDQHFIWAHEGVISPADRKSALRAMESYHRWFGTLWMNLR